MDATQDREAHFLDTPVIESATPAASSRDISGLTRYFCEASGRFNMKVDALSTRAKANTCTQMIYQCLIFNPFAK